MKQSNASLKERLSDWTSWDIAMYHIGTCLGFWPEFGAPYNYDQWHGAKGVIWSGNPLGDALSNFIVALSEEGCLERRDEPDIEYRWNPNYKGGADVLTILE
jgi:hypothetical protein